VARKHDFAHDFTAALGHAELDMNIGRAIGEGKLGDPCPRLITNLAWSEKAIVMASRNVEAGVSFKLRHCLATLLAACLLFLPLQAAPPDDVRAHIFRLFDQADEATKAKDFRKAQALFEEAKIIILNREGDFQDYVSMLGRAALEVRLANVVHDGKLGDPCRHFDAGKAYLALLVGIKDDGGIHPEAQREFNDQVAAEIDVGSVRSGCSARSTVLPDAGSD
jgi:hypothetical protein